MTLPVAGYGNQQYKLKSNPDENGDHVVVHEIEGEVTTRPVVTDTLPFSVEATEAGVQLPSQPCRAVHIQSRRWADDGVTEQLNYVWVILDDEKIYELSPGGVVTIAVSNADRITLMAFEGTNLISGGIEQ